MRKGFPADPTSTSPLCAVSLPPSITSRLIREPPAWPLELGWIGTGREASCALLIAAVARGLEATIVTRDCPDFERQGASELPY